MRHNVTAQRPAFALFAALSLAIAFGASACGGGGTTAQRTTTAPTQAAGAEIPTVDITVVEYSFDAPDTIPGGLTRVRVHNAGTEEHATQLFRLNAGATPEQIRAALAKGPTREGITEGYALGAWAGGLDVIPPGVTSEAVLDLEPGQYVLWCFNSSPDGKRHWEKGEFRPLQVTAAPAIRPSEPQARATVRMSEFAFDAPDTLPEGKSTVHVVNDGQQFHEMRVYRLNDGVTAEQLRQAFVSGAPGTPLPTPLTYANAGTSVGGMNELSAGRSGWVTLDLKPGAYALLCFVFDRTTFDRLHIQLGMFHAFTVQ